MAPPDMQGEHRAGRRHVRSTAHLVSLGLVPFFLFATAFEVLYSMINDAGHAPRNIVLPTRLIPRESCGCHPDAATAPWLVG